MTHGTQYGYDFHGCRCEKCRAAKATTRTKYRARMAAYMRGWRSRNRERAREQTRESMRRLRARRAA